MSEQKDVDKFLAHYGVLGMKWGTRKTESRRSKIKKARVKNSTAKNPESGMSMKTLKLGNAATNSMMAGLGTFAVSILAKRGSKLKMGLQAASLVLNVSGMALLGASTRSENTDLINKYK